MAGSVTEREGYSVVDQRIIYDEKPSTFDKADKLAGFKVDRRRSYLIMNNEIRYLVTWTSTCSGCDGGGCRECGYKGKRKNGSYVPLSGLNIKD